MRKVLLALLVLLLAGCAGSAGRMLGTQAAMEAVSQATPQGSTGDARNRAKAHTELASIYYQNGRLAIALEELRAAVAADSGYAPAHNVLALVQMDMRENAAAEQSFQRALSLAPGDPEINNNYGWFLCQTGRVKDALGYFGQAASNPLYETPEKAHINAGLCALKLGDEKGAEESFSRALRYVPNNPLAMYQLATLRYKQGSFDGARRLIEGLVAQGEPDAATLWLAVRLQRKLGDGSAEASYAAQLRRRFADSKEYQELLKGNYE